MRLRKSSLLSTLNGFLALMMLIAGLVAGLSLLDTLTSNFIGDLSIGVPAETVVASLPGGVELHDIEPWYRREPGLATASLGG